MTSDHPTNPPRLKPKTSASFNPEVGKEGGDVVGRLIRMDIARPVSAVRPWPWSSTAITCGPGHMRDRASVQQFFTGLRLQAPLPDAPAEVTYLGLWGCEDPGLADSDGSRWGYWGLSSTVTARPAG